MTPGNTWSCLFTNAIFDNLLKQTQFNAIRDKGNHNFYQIISKAYQFIGIFLLRGYRKIPEEKDYWSSQTDLQVPFIANAMIRNKYFADKAVFTCCRHRNLVEGSKIAKIKPPYDAFNMILKQFGILHDKLSIEKTMVPYKGLYSIRQYMKSKPFADLFWRIKGTPMQI